MIGATYGFDAVAVVHCELGVVRSLDAFVDDAVDYTQSVEVELDTLLGAVGDLLVFTVEVVEEL